MCYELLDQIESSRIPRSVLTVKSAAVETRFDIVRDGSDFEVRLLAIITCFGYRCEITRDAILSYRNVLGN